MDAMCKATRPECRSVTDPQQMKGPHFVLRCGLPVRALGRFGEVNLLGSDVDQDVLALVAPLEVSPVPFVYLSTRSGDLPRIESHHGPPYHVPAQ